MRLASPVGHLANVERLWEARRRGRLPHALVFEGPEGIGKYLAATWFAAGLLCESGPGAPCLACGPCKRLASGEERGNHPDLFVLDVRLEEEEYIRIGRIAYRDRPSASAADPEDCVERFLELRPHEGRGRLVLLREAHRMNASAQNALLKTLEEPRPGTLLLLETHRPESLLSTILSRCVRLRFEPLTTEECARVLADRGLAPDRAHRLARWAGGSPGNALALAERGAEESVPLLGALLRGEGEPLACATALLEVEGDFHGKSPLARQRDRAREACALATALLRDVVRAAAGLDPAALPHGELAALALEARPSWSEQDWSRRLELALATRADLERNVHPDASVERLILGLARGPLAS